MQNPQHDDPPRDARQLPNGVILVRGKGVLSSAPSHAPTPLIDPGGPDIQEGGGGVVDDGDQVVPVLRVGKNQRGPSG